jgi:hypothetical protein
MPTHRAATYPTEKPSASTVASVEVGPLDPTTSDPVRAAGGGFPGMDYQVFEVTDLPIPAGTDWSSTPLTIGNFEAAAFHGHIAVVYLLLSPAPPVGIQLIASRPTDAPHQIIADAASGVGSDAALWEPITGTDQARPVTAELWSDSEITADITIVRARAAFLIL